MSNEKKEFIMPVIVLTVICLVISAALALTNSLTRPVIEAAAARRADETRLAVLPQADAFERLEAYALPESIAAAYKAANGAGYVFTVKTKGYGGDMEILCGIDAGGKITACITLSHLETAGLGSKIADDEYQDQYVSKGADLAGVSGISGATASSVAYKNAIRDAFSAFETVKGATQ